MKGYYTAQGFLGWMDGAYRLFSCDTEYYEIMDGHED